MAKTSKKLSEVEEKVKIMEKVDKAQTTSIEANTKAIINQMTKNDEQQKEINNNKKEINNNKKAIEDVSKELNTTKKLAADKVSKADQKLKDDVQDLNIKETSKKVDAVADSVYQAKADQIDIDYKQDTKIKQVSDKVDYESNLNKKVDEDQSASIIRMSDRITSLWSELDTAKESIINLQKKVKTSFILNIAVFAACVLVSFLF